MVQQAIKKCRDAPAAQLTAKQLAGQTYITYSHQKFDTHPIPRRVLQDNYQFYINPDMLMRNIWIDAGTVEPLEYIQHVYGIWMKGQERPIVESELMNKGVGTCYP